jgi:hypothetical protein
MADFPDIEPDLEEIGLIANNQVYDSILTGQVQTASLSGAKWTCAPTFSNRNGKEARDLRAFIFGQNGVSGRFNYYPASIDNVGTHAGLGVVDGAGQTGSTLVTKDWDADQSLLFAAGDYLTVNGEMKMVTADVGTTDDRIEYDETNYMSSPFDPSGWSGASDPDLSYTSTTETNPSGESFVGEFEYIGPSFPLLSTASYISSPVIGDYFFCVQIKSEDINAGLRIIFRSVATTQIANIYINAITGNFTDGGYGVSTNNIFTSSGENIIQVKIPYLGGQSEIRTEFYFYEVDPNGNQSGFPVVGDKIKIQAAFFGKADDWPAKLRADATIPITPPMRTSPADGALIEANNPYFQGRLESDDMSRLQVSSPVIYNTTLSIVEAF